MRDALLGLDIGTTNCKAILFDLAGRQVGGGSAPTPTYEPAPGRAEHDPEALWATVAATIRQALAGAGDVRVRGVAVASVGEAGTLIDARGRALCPIIAWHDGRTEEQFGRWQARADQGAWYAATGVVPKPIYSVFKLQWLREHAPEAYAAASRWLLVADYIAHRLCGAEATDHSLATRTLLFDLRGRRWAEALVEEAGIRPELLPELAPSGTRVGAVTREASAATGLPAGAPVALGGHDHIVGALAAGVSAPGTCLDSMGTAEAVFLPLGAPPPALPLDQGITFGAHVARGRFYTLDGLWSGGGAVAWARALLLGEERGGGFARFEALAASAPPGSRGVLFLPRLMAGERGAFAGLTTAAGPPELARAVYEGLAFAWRAHLERIEAALGLRAETIRLIGGGARSAIWVQVKADALGRPLRVLEMKESVALGCALLAGIAAGVYRDEADALGQLAREEHMVEPDAARVALYEQRYREGFLPLAQALAGMRA